MSNLNLSLTLLDVKLVIPSTQSTQKILGEHHEEGHGVVHHVYHHFIKDTFLETK